MKRILVGLRDEQQERLRREATRRRTSIASLVRDAVDRAFSDELQQRREIHRRSTEVVGRFRSGRHDVSERHDEHLAQAYGADLERGLTKGG